MINIQKKIAGLYPEVHAETKPPYNTTGKKKLFNPRLKRLHHLHPNGSKMVRNPLSILGEELYRLWQKARDAVRGFFRRIHPKNNQVIYGVQKHGAVVGKITFSEREDADKPIFNLLVELWGRTRFGGWRKLGESLTSEDGEFEVPYDLDAVTGLGLRGGLILEILHFEGIRWQDRKNFTPEYELFESIKIPKAALVGLKYNVGLVQLHFWEYRTDLPLPRVQITDVDKTPPQKWSQARMDTISKQFIPVELATLKLKSRLHRESSRNGLNGNQSKLTIDDIQSYFPVNLSQGMDRLQHLPQGQREELIDKFKLFENPPAKTPEELRSMFAKDHSGIGQGHSPGKLSRSDAYFGMRMMNGVYANIFDKWPEDPNLYWVHYHWSSYDHEDDTYIFPDVTCKFRMNEEGYLMPSEILIKGALKKGEAAGTRRTMTPEDGEKWEAAKRIARVQAALSAQVDKHYVGTHVNVEQYAIAIHRNIQRNPIGSLYHPHLRGITLVNHMADKILVNPDGFITQASALTGKGLIDRCVDTLGTHDWKNFRPLEPISDKHAYAIVSNLFWDILEQFVSEFMTEYEIGIKQYWREIHAFSQDLVAHSVPVFLCSYLGKHQQAEGANLGDWYTKSGRMDLSLEREKHDGLIRAVSPITSSPDFNPDSDDWENLKQVTVYLIFQASLGHFWSNYQQYDDIGELKYSTLGLRYGTGPDGALGPEDDESIAPDKEVCIRSMWFANMLSRTGYGFIMANEDHDIHPRLIELLKENEATFEACNFDIYDLQSRTNI